MSPQAGKAVADLLTPDKDGRIYSGQGKYTDEFEQAFSIATGLSRPILGVNSCTAAIDLSLHLIGVGPGDEVIAPALTCSATLGPVVNRGATIIWADVDSITGLISPLSVASLMTEQTKAVIAVDWAGRACDYRALSDASLGTVPIIEDAAHRLYLPPEYGDYVCYSFGPIKVLSMGGYGGALLPPGHEYKRAELLRWHGLDRHSNKDFRCGDQDITDAGYRYHMTDDQAVIGLANLPMAQRHVKQARANAQWYCEQLADVPGITVPPFDPSCDYWLFGILVHLDRDGFSKRMIEQGVPTSRVHARNDKHSAFRAASRTPVPLDGTDYCDSHQTNLPVGAWITSEERQQVVQAVKNAVGVPV